MKRKIFIVEFFVTFLLLLFVAGCGSIVMGGKSFDYSAVPKIEKGKSTQQDIQKIFGEPFSVRKTETGEVWNYYVTEGKPGPIPRTSNHSLDVYFDKSGTVADYTYKE